MTFFLSMISFSLFPRFQYLRRIDSKDSPPHDKLYQNEIQIEQYKSDNRIGRLDIGRNIHPHHVRKKNHDAEVILIASVSFEEA